MKKNNPFVYLLAALIVALAISCEPERAEEVVLDFDITIPSNCP